MRIVILRKLSVFLFIFLFSSVGYANTIVLDTTVNLANGQSWQATIDVVSGELLIFSSTTQGSVNLTIKQQNSTVFSSLMAPTSPINQSSVIVDSGELHIMVSVSQNIFFEASIVIQLTQSGMTELNGLMIAGGVLIVLLLPFVFLLGKNKGN